MGLAINVGTLAFYAEEDDAEGIEMLEADVAIINGLLASAGLPSHTEPREIGDRSRAGIDSFPYSFIHYLRRAYAHRKLDPGWKATPLPDSEDPEDAAYAQVADEMESHLVNHSDCEGFYVPVDFTDILGSQDLAGGALGSSQQLMRELVLVAPALGITLENGQLADAEANRINTESESGGLERELCSWIALYEAARVSIGQRTLIVFS